MTATAIWKKSICYAVKSDVGLRRTNNQDSSRVIIASTVRQWLDRGHLFVVADGMGAHAAGEVASKLAVETITKSYLGRINEPPGHALVQSVYDAHAAIRTKSREEAYHDMGTTCDAFALTPQGLFIAHVGDSRVYRLRGNTYDQLTFDHSLVWEVCVKANLPFDQPPPHIPKNQITQSLGPTEKLHVDLEGPLPIEPGDTYLACSDGLSGPVKDYEMGQILSVFSPETAAETLVNLANLRGGPDNITVVIARPMENGAEYQSVDNEMQVPGWQWTLLGASALAGLAAGLSFAFGYIQAGALCAVLAAAALTAFFVITQKTLFAGSPFTPASEVSGYAPYQTWDCTPTQEFADVLAQLVRELFQATQGKRLTMPMQTILQYESEAVQGCQNGNFNIAVKNYALIINSLMRKIKKH